ncbi:MAG: 30S ribosomal protein S12 methylthiotransferase RimO [Arenicellales bacterium]|nr:30S ribosomal protein S12 methylthiotransferase RimO [Arenicellales bacterium]MDP6552054.1 30S ribosomal protein S12 methylthiotransferase RimO [Arenicellales bacterium]MDP6791566.1 30S ribosomal protein S12 methylthiotransferase RimO [Arenicellales bacterium]MDP6918000.1 30S ribosomal protein S12 methylthiotransferase RimO [Arenicellales bacterium]
MTRPTVGFVSLGCAKATVDSERILTQLRAEGYGFSEIYDHADVVVVNTCGFIDAAVEESLATIDEAMSANGRVIVTGCLGARAEMLREKFPDLLAVTGPEDTESVMSAVHASAPPLQEPLYHLLPPGGVKLTPRHYAYLKISEGCNHRCSFCIIPTMRGRLASRDPSDVLVEAGQLVEAGVSELLVVSQDTSAYGVDLKKHADLMTGEALRPDVTSLARALGELGVWVRLHYVYPYPHVDDLVTLMADGLVLPYLDVPFQHASPRILGMMKRPASGEDNLARIQSWRQRCPGLAIRSTFIVGFPGETEDDFSQLLAFLHEAQLDRVGCFVYSPVSGARANDLPDPVDASLAQQRYAALMQVQAEVSKARLQNRVGSQCVVVIDEVDGDGALGRSYAESPEVDGVIRLSDTAGLAVGQRVEVKITGYDAHDLSASVLNS